MKASALVMTLLMVALVVSAVTMLVITNTDSDKNSLVENLKDQVAVLNKRIEELEKTKNLPAEKPMPGEIFTAKDDSENRFSLLEGKVNELSAKVDEFSAKLTEIKETPPGYIPRNLDSSVGRLLADMGDDPEKAMRSFMQTDAGKGMMKMSQRMMTADLERRLTLDDTQKQKLADIMDRGFRDVMDAVNNMNDNTTTEESRAQMQRIMEDYSKEIEGILDAEQLEKFKEMGGMRLPNQRGPMRFRAETPQGE